MGQPFSSKKSRMISQITETFGSFLSVLVWGLFGALLVPRLLTGSDWRPVLFAVLSLTLIRMLPVALAMRGAAMVAHDTQHHLLVLGVARERAKLGRHFGGGGIRDAGHDRRQRAAQRAAGLGVIGNARRHHEPAHVGVA